MTRGEINRFDPERLIDLRNQRGATITELGVASGVSYQTISMWEAGKTRPTARTLRLVAAALGVTIEDMLLPVTGNTTLTDLRVAKGLSQEQAARAAAMTRQVLSAYEGGRHPGVHIPALAKLYGVSPSQVSDAWWAGKVIRQRRAERKGLTIVPPDEGAADGNRTRNSPE